MYNESKSHPFPSLEAAITNRGNPSPKHILIITQDIVGPINNGGIGTAYYYAANELARMGHRVSVLYTLNRYTEKKNIDHWIRDYKGRDVTLIPCPDPDVPVFPGIHGMVASIPYSAYEWLKRHEDEFDIVHGSEWCANLFYCLLAKKLGMRFRNLQFVVKTSSPHIWARIGNNDPINQYTDLPRIFMERMCVEWADHVIGGSHYLLNWMEQNGYQLPDGRCYVQPNIFPPIPVAESKQDPLTHATELVFFGRLERRKGLHLLLDALKRLLRTHAQGKVDLTGVSITFLGKSRRVYNAKKDIASTLDGSVLSYRILDDLGQPQAIQYLKEGDGKLAIMPSVMDNSPFGVYELLGYKVPFITSTAGGGKELIHEADRERVLFEVHPHAIHQILLRLIHQPLYIPRPSFDMRRSLEIWDQWHRALPPATTGNAATSEARRADSEPLVSICLAHFNRPRELSEALDSIKALTYRNIELIIVDDGSTSPAALACLDTIQQQAHGFPLQVYTQPNLYLGASRNLAASHAQGEFLLFMDDDNLAKPDEITMLVAAMVHANADIITSFADTFWSKDIGNLAAAARKRIVYFGADLTSGMYRNPYGDSNCLVRRSAFEKLGGFTEDYKIGRDDQEFFSRAVLSGMKLYVLPEAVYWYRLSRTRMRQDQFSQFAGLQRVGNPYIEVPGLPVEYANILRYSQGLAAVRLGVVANTMSQLSQNSRLRKLVQRFPVIYRALGKLHRLIT
jgi:glycosyltransferase involved in cell wall biosynthesis